MKKGIVVAVLVAFAAFAFGAVVVSAEEGMKTINADAKLFPAKKLNADGTKKKGPVSFDHAKHGKNLGCKECHHTQPTLGTDAAVKGTSCFTCHGADAKDKQPDTYEMIHGKSGKCLACHKDVKAKDAASKAPTACKECHGGGE